MQTFHAQILLYDGFSNMVLACALEPLRAVRDQMPGAVTWEVLSATDAPALSSSGLEISPSGRWATSGPADALIVIASYNYRSLSGPAAVANLRRMARRAKLVIGADAGGWLMAAAGLLDGKRATVHWQITTEFADAFPRVELAFDRFVRDGRVATCGGASTMLDLILKVIEDRFGPALAFDVSTLFIHDAARQHDHGRGPGRLTTESPMALRKAVSLMVDTIEAPLSLHKVAQKCGVSERSLTRLFTAQLGMSPGKYYQALRLSRARDLAASGQYPLSEVALMTGFASSATLSRAFSAQFGQTLSQARKQGR